MSKTILVIGATGKQGRAVIDALLTSPNSSEFTLLGLTRSPESASAKGLVAKGVKTVQGDLNDVPTAFSNAKKVAGTSSIWGVFVALVPQKSGPSEEDQGKAIIDASLESGVKYFVYSSVDRGGNEKSWENPTNIPHFVTKHGVELYLREKAGSTMSWTILRPVAFMDNCTKSFFGKVFDTAWRTILADKPLQLIAVKDIGGFAGVCFQDSEKWNGKAVALAGDELTFAQANDVFKKVTGTTMPETFSVITSTLTYLVKELSTMFAWFKAEGYATDIPSLKAAYPGLHSWEEWLKTESDWKKTG